MNFRKKTSAALAEAEGGHEKAWLANAAFRGVCMSVSF